VDFRPVPVFEAFWMDHLRAIDKRRIRRIFGQASATELTAIDLGPELFISLGTTR